MLEPGPLRDFLAKGEPEFLAADAPRDAPAPPAPGLLRTRALEGRRLLARELGLSSSRPTGPLLGHDGGDGLVNALAFFEPAVAKSLARARLAVAHLVAACLETGRALWLPALHHEDRVFFLWTYLDLQSLEELGVDHAATHLLAHAKEAPFANASLVSVDEATARVATDDARDDAVTAFELPAGARPERVLYDLARLHRPELLLLHLPFLRRDQPKRAPGSLARRVLGLLRWCPDLLAPDHDARVATPAASCWGRGASLDA